MDEQSNVVVSAADAERLEAYRTEGVTTTVRLTTSTWKVWDARWLEGAEARRVAPRIAGV